MTSKEKASETSLDSFFRITVGSVQTMQREKRLNHFSPDTFQTIIVDEAHHALANGYQTVLNHFPNAEVLGVTATPERKNVACLGEYFSDRDFYGNRLRQQRRHVSRRFGRHKVSKAQWSSRSV